MPHEPESDNKAPSAQIANFWAQLEAELVELPSQKREEFLLEVRAHLEGSVTARQAEGASEEVAWQQALSAFGDSREVGRALWQQWAASRQLESEGTPLSRRGLLRKYGKRLALGLGVHMACVLFVGGIVVGGAQTWEQIKLPLFALCAIFSFCFVLYRFRGKWRWTPANISGLVFIAAQYGCILANMQWGARWRTTAYGEWIGKGEGIVWGLMLVGFMWLYKRELPKRPWQFATNYKQNPAAAEQQYKIAPLLGAVIGISLNFINIICAIIVLCCPPWVTWSCSGLILTVALVGFWLNRNQNWN